MTDLGLFREPDDEPVDLGEVASLLSHRSATGDEEPYLWDTEFVVGRNPILMRVFAGAEGEVVIVEVACVILDLDPDRLLAVEPSSPLVDIWLAPEGDEEEDKAVDEAEAAAAEEEEEGPDWLVVSGSYAVADGAAGLQGIIDAASSLLRRLAETGAIMVADVVDVDPEVAGRALMLEELKAQRPQEAMDSALELAERSRAAGDFVTAAWFDLAAAEVADELGEASLSWALASGAWVTLGEPIGEATTVVAYAGALAGQGRFDEAVDLVERAEAAATEPADAAYLRGNRGVFLGRWGRMAEAIDAMEASVDDPALAPQWRTLLLRQLAVVRGSFGGYDGPPLDESDWLDEADADINEIARLLAQAMSPADLAAAMLRVEQALARLRGRWDRLGRGQRIRVLAAEGVLWFHAGRHDDARRQFRLAELLAEEGSHVDVARSVKVVAASLDLDEPVPEALLAEASPRERLMFHFNRAYHGLTASAARLRPGEDGMAAIERSLEPVLRAVRVVDEERHEFDAVADRAGWATFGGRVYELALIITTTIGRRDLVVELLERVRAQGFPGATPPGTAAPSPAPTLRAALDALDVETPRIATLAGTSRVTPGAATIRLDRLVARIAGEDAWWWSCHSYGERIYWAVRSPAGVVSAGHKVAGTDGGPSLETLAALFAAPGSRGEMAEHVLMEDSHHRLDDLLRRLADDLLPLPIADAARLGASVGRPIRLVWVPPPSLGSLPIALLPLDDRYRLLHGAIVAIAPPTSLVSIVSPTRGAGGGRAPVEETVILGAGDDLGHAGDIVGPEGLAIPPARVAGTPAHLRRVPPLAGSPASPRTVLESWAADPPALTLYYGHVDEGGPGRPLAASLRLSDESGRAPLEVRSLLVGGRTGAPEVVVLCGCSSLEPSAIGSGEWWGFGIALLWKGSRQVVGSQWHLLDIPATARFAVELVSRLRTAKDAPAVLRRLQLKWLDQWELARDQTCTESSSDRHPILWAGWAVTGVSGA